MKHKQFEIVVIDKGYTYKGCLLIRYKDHEWFGKNCEEINKQVDIHGGLVFSEEVGDVLINNFKELTIEDKDCWIIGFEVKKVPISLVESNFCMVYDDVKKELFQKAVALYKGNKNFDREYEDIEKPEEWSCSFCRSLKIEIIDHNIASAIGSDDDYYIQDNKLIYCQECRKESIIDNQY